MGQEPSTESSTICPSEEEIWDYFTTEMLPIIKKWQLETSRVGMGVVEVESGCDMLNSLLSTIVTHLESEGVPVHRVSKFVHNKRINSMV